LKRINKLLNVSRSINLNPLRSLKIKGLFCLIAILTSAGCTKTVVKTVKVDSFCQGKYEPLWLNNGDFDIIGELFLNKKYSPVISKYIDYHALNGKEYQICLDKKW